ncbi:amidase [Parasphingopyxis algicola]|uniref:amidase family protein n=1 Tax=Parasphingopyxis algicola TaxID=2026624 RepID=UPI0015A2425F|nr:amidase [Parasphingopyxis algicola]QLC23925.1 amidase [Parasphingopyxis algicola]
MNRRAFSQLFVTTFAAAATGSCRSMVDAPSVDDPTVMSIRQLGEAFRANTLDPVAVTEEFLERIANTQSTINAYSHIDREGALAGARAARDRFARGNPIGPLDGIPLAFKDQFQVAGMQRHFGSALRMGGPPDASDEQVVARIRATGCVILGKTTQCDEGAVSISRSSATGITRNPAARDCHAGGSSSGAAAAAAARLGPIQMAADQGGSIREPASLTGCYGFKPSTGLIPRDSEYGVYGPIAAQLADIRPVLEAAAGRVLPHHMSHLADLRIAYMPYCGDCLPPSPAVADACSRAVERLQASGVEVTQIEPVIPYGVLKDIAAYFYAESVGEIVGEFGLDAVLASGERCFAEHAQATIALDPEAIGEWAGSAFASLDSALEAHPVHTYDIVLTPTIPFVAFPLERCYPTEAETTPDYAIWKQRYGISQEHSVALAVGTYMKTPEITFPVAGSEDTKPVGLSAVASRGGDAVLLEFAELADPVLVSG